MITHNPEAAAVCRSYRDHARRPHRELREAQGLARRARPVRQRSGVLPRLRAPSSTPEFIPGSSVPILPPGLLSRSFATNACGRKLVRRFWASAIRACCWSRVSRTSTLRKPATPSALSHGWRFAALLVLHAARCRSGRASYRAVVLAVESYDDADKWGDEADNDADLSYLIARLRLSDLGNSAAPYHDPYQQWKAARGILLEGAGLQTRFRGSAAASGGSLQLRETVLPRFVHVDLHLSGPA